MTMNIAVWGVISGPITETLKGRITGFYGTYDGLHRMRMVYWMWGLLWPRRTIATGYRSSHAI